MIEKTGFAGYFLIVWDIVKFAREKEIAVGPGRGSAAGSIVSYCLGITDIDPLRFGLLFERFLTADRISPPDIDTDFHDGRRDEVISYIKQRWGMDAVSQIITFGSMAAKGAIRDVGRVLKVPLWKVDKLSKAIGWAPDSTIDKALERSTEFKALYQEEEENRKVVDSARQLEGIIRQASTHAAGVVITPGGIRSFVPLHHGSNNEIVTGYDMDSIAEAGLLKMDVLGLRTLTVIEDALAMIRHNHGHDVRAESLALDDPQTYSLIASGQTSGIFQLESGGMRDLCRRSTPTCIEDLSAILALYRPGPLGSGMVEDYVARKGGGKKVEYLHPALKPILEETYGVFVYQEQIMQMAQVLAGFSLSEGDILRKAMAKKDNKTLEKIKPRFLEGAKEHGVDPKIANQIIEILGPFADYCFNKPHTASYAILAYQTAFLKAHYPQEFMAACLSSEINDTDKLADYITECRNLGIEVHPPDINESEALFTVVEGRIRFGMAAIKNVGLPAIGMVTATRQAGGKFRSLTDFCCKIDMGIANRKVLESLIRAGAFDALGYTRPEYLHILPGCMEIGARMANERDTGKMFMFGGGDSASANIADADPRGASEWSRAQILDEEKQIFGFYLSGHPHEEQYQLVDQVVTDHAADLEGGKKRKVKVGGLITTMRQITDKNGKEMAFVAMQDSTGTFEVTVFASLFSKVELKLLPDSFVIVTGKLEANSDRGAKIIADDVLGLDEATPQRLHKVHVRIYLDNHSEQQMESLRVLAQPDPESPDLYLHIISEDKAERVLKAGPNFRIPNGDKILERVRGLFGAANVWVE